MNRLFKVLPVLLIALVLVAAPASADVRYGTQTSNPLNADGVFTGQDGAAMDYGVWVYGITLFADEANSFAGIYNADTEAEFIAANLRDEIGEATQYDTAFHWYEGGPRYFSDGIGAVIEIGSIFVHYGKEPQ